MSRATALRLLIAVGVGVLVVLIASNVSQLVYPAPPVPVGDAPEGHAEVFWGEGEVHGWHGGSDSPSAPLVLFFHGNGENLETLKWSGLFDRFRQLDVYSVVVEYPGYGRSSGRSSETALIAAALEAFDWADNRFGERRIVVVGWSLGAAVAVQVAAARPDRVDGLVLMSAWSRLHDVASRHFPGFLVRLLLRERYDSVAAAAAVRCPSLVVHGVADRIIPVEQGRRVADSLEGSRWVELEGSGHNDLLGREEVWSEIGAFLARER